MGKAVIRDGDPTITGGFVIASKATMFDGGKRVALDGDVATCGNCPKTYRIYGTGDGTFENGTHVVVEGDLVFCPCGQNRVLRGAKPGMFIETVRESPRVAAPASASPPAKPQANRSYSKRIVLKDTEGHPVPDQRYKVTTEDGDVHEGVTNGHGETTWIYTNEPQKLTIELME